MSANDDTVLRRATRLDVEKIHAMIRALAGATGEERKVSSNPEDFLRHGFGAEPLFEAILAERGGQAVGLCLYFYSFSTWLGEPGIYVQDLYVAESERGRGLGRRLMAAAARRGAEREAGHLRLSVHAANAAAKAFYERLGMEHRVNEHVYHIGGRPFAALAEATP